jgi:L-alanine-DL-glutamate epimerase-like enolase superfamily enzyme
MPLISRRQLTEEAVGMKITDIKLTTISIPYRNGVETWSSGSRKGITNVIVEVETDAGITGLGDAPAFPNAPVVCAALESSKRLLVGESPFLIERFVKRFYADGGWHFYRRLGNIALGALEMALWDIVGKATDRPLHELFGGCLSDRVLHWHYLLRQPRELMIQEAKDYAARGFPTLYFKVGIDPDDDLELVRAIRKAVGDKVNVRIDANEAWTPGHALWFINAIDDLNVEFVEQPLHNRDLDGMAFLRSKVRTPIGANQGAWTSFDVLEIIKKQAADVLLFCAHQEGGLLAFKKLAALAESAALPVVRHSYGETGIGTFAHAHVISTCGNCLYANDEILQNIERDIIEQPAEFDRGYLPLPKNPGIGVTLDRDQLAIYAENYRVNGEYDPTAPTPGLERSRPTTFPMF